MQRRTERERERQRRKRLRGNVWSVESQRSGGFAMVGWEASARHMWRIFIRGLPPIPSISTLLAADPCHAASPTDVASIVPGQFASRRGDHQRSLSPANRIRQRAESFPSNRSPPQRKTIFHFVSISPIIYRITLFKDFRFSLQIILDSFASIFHSAQLFARVLFPFFPRRHGTRNYEGSDSFRSRGHATPALDGAAWRGPVS